MEDRSQNFKLMSACTGSGVSNSTDPVDCSAPGSSVNGFSGKNTGVGCHILLHQADNEVKRNKSSIQESGFVLKLETMEGLGAVLPHFGTDLHPDFQKV